MNCLLDLKQILASKGHDIIRFNGWQLETPAGVFTMAFGDYSLNSKVLSKQELAGIINGKPQKTQSKEPESRLPDVQAAQGERSKTVQTRKGRSGKGKRDAQSRATE